MRISKREGEGFTLIELLIVVAILGVLVAIVIPNVGRFIGRGEEEAWKTELANVQAAVTAMMVDNQESQLPYPVGLPGTNDMGAFPDPTSACGVAGEKEIDPDGDLYQPSDKDGYLLYEHDLYGGDGTDNITVNYVAAQYTKGVYSIDEYGTVTQESTGYE